MTRRQYRKIVRRFSKGIVRTMVYAIALASMYAVARAAAGPLEQPALAFALLAAIAGAMLAVSVLGLVVGWLGWQRHAGLRTPRRATRVVPPAPAMRPTAMGERFGKAAATTRCSAINEERFHGRRSGVR